jgi:methylmalonyl-CoA/ethylmalonyl-CoA epimerase
MYHEMLSDTKNVPTETLEVFGRGAKLHHVGIAVRSLGDLGVEDKAVNDPLQRVSVAFVDIHGTLFELIEPSGEHSPIQRSLESGQRLMHVCYTVPDLSAALTEGRRHGFHRIRQSVPAVAFAGRKIAWVFSSTYGLVELLEDAGCDEWIPGDPSCASRSSMTTG